MVFNNMTGFAVHSPGQVQSFEASVPVRLPLVRSSLSHRHRVSTINCYLRPPMSSNVETAVIAKCKKQSTEFEPRRISTTGSPWTCSATHKRRAAPKRSIPSTRSGQGRIPCNDAKDSNSMAVGKETRAHLWNNREPFASLLRLP